MKKILFLLLALLPVVASAQNEDMRVSVAPHAGMTISKMDGDALNRTKTWKIGWTAGAEVEIPLSRYFSLTTGVDYSAIGTGFKDEHEPYATIKSHINVDYVSVPLQLKAYFKGVKGLAAHVGAEIGIRTSRGRKVSLLGGQPSFHCLHSRTPFLDGRGFILSRHLPNLPLFSAP